MNSFEGQVALVTGASSGIGRAITLALARKGATVHAVGRREAALRDLAEACPGPIETHRLDLGHPQEIDALVRALAGGQAGVDVLVHSAGVFAMGPVEEGSMAAFDEMWRVNLLGPYLLTQGLLPVLRTARAQVVFINSTAGLQAKGGLAQYAATKAGLKAVADSLRDEVNADGMRVLSVFPGRTRSVMQARIHELEGRAYDPERLMSPDAVAEIVTDALALDPSAELTDLTIRPMSKLA